MKECIVSLHGQNYLCWSLNADIGSTSVLPLPSSLSLLPALQPVGEGRIPAGWGLSPGRTGALSPEGRSHSLTDSLASSDQAASKGEREREGERSGTIIVQMSTHDETGAHATGVSP